MNRLISTFPSNDKGIDYKNENSVSIDKDFMIHLLEQDTKEKDLYDIDKFLSDKSSNPNLIGEGYYYRVVEQDLTSKTLELYDEVCRIVGIDNQSLESIGVPVNGAKSFSGDYRITIQNSNLIKYEDVVNFIREFHRKTNGMPYCLKLRPGDSDLLILYVKATDLSKTVNILDSISNELTKNFGVRKPFTVSMDYNSFYGISSYVYNSVTRFQGDLKRGGRTHSVHTGDLLDKAYNNLYMKYNSDISKITNIEMYEEMLRLHKLHFGFDVNENIPLWMNKDNYELCKVNGINFNNKFNKAKELSNESRIISTFKNDRFYEINQYLLQLISGKDNDYNKEGNLVSKEKMIVTYDELKTLFKSEEYKIISIKIHDSKQIEVELGRFEKKRHL